MVMKWNILFKCAFGLKFIIAQKILPLINGYLTRPYFQCILIDFNVGGAVWG